MKVKQAVSGGGPVLHRGFHTHGNSMCLMVNFLFRYTSCMWCMHVMYRAQQFPCTAFFTPTGNCCAHPRLMCNTKACLLTTHHP